ncbi:MAG: DNA cytosine methyltransferase [Hyphomicrobiaceae bacterium]|nr:MAG: DNA cytosine methyltransferase [Hyphomicrobiaceae bacterium]
MHAPAIAIKTYRHGHIFCGLGGGARGFNRGKARVGNIEARFECAGGIDSDPAALADFERLAGVPGTQMDLFSREQYIAFHGHEPPKGWREAAPANVRAALGHLDIAFTSSPCKGFSGLLSETASRMAKYQALNGLTLRGVWLLLEAYKDDPIKLILFENVPRIATRGRHLLDQIIALLRAYGYAVAETTHDCGELGGLAQSRKRFLLVARHAALVPPFLYEPPKMRLRGVGEVLERLPVPGPGTTLPMHRMPALQWRTWVRLAFVEAGSDWRSLNKLAVENGFLRDYGIAPGCNWNSDVLGVRRWDEPSGTVTGRAGPMNGAFSVADPRVDGHEKSVQMGVGTWDQPAAVIKGDVSVGTGRYAVADPRIPGKPRFNTTFRIVRWGETSPAVAGPGGPAGGLAVADPRADGGFGGKGKYRVTAYDEPAGSVIGASTTGQGACAVADPRTDWPAGTHQSKLAVQDWQEPSKTVTGSDRVGSGALSVADPRPRALTREDRDGYLTQGHYGVVPWEKPSGAVTANGQHDNGRWSVADPRPAEGETLPGPDDRLVAVIIARDGTWHRPFTLLELVCLQSLIDPDEVVDLHGQSESAKRERVGNAVPSDSAAAIAGVMGRTLLLAELGETFMLSAEPIWVRPMIAGLMAAIAEDLETYGRAHS